MVVQAIEGKECFSIPKWLNEGSLEENLRNHYKTDIEVMKFVAKPAAVKHFASSLYQVQVTFSFTPENDGSTLEKLILTINLIVKDIVANEIAKTALMKFNVFEKEIRFYAQIAPKINKKLMELGEHRLCAEAFGTCSSKEILILEDLSDNGYQVPTLRHGFDLNSTKAILRRVAQFHAVCAVLQQQEPGIFADFKNGRLSRSMDGLSNIFTGNFEIIIDTISQWPDFAVYAEKLRRLQDEVIERGRKAYDVNPDHFNTLCHDDLWSTNFMMKARSGSEEEPFENIILIDFQFSYWGSPATDLYYFLNTSLCESFRPHCINELVKFYHEQLTGFLGRFNYTKHIPTWTEFEVQYQERKFLAFMMSCLIQPMQFSGSIKISPEELFSDSEHAMTVKRRVYQTEKTQKTLRKLIPFYDSIGIFD